MVLETLGASYVVVILGVTLNTRFVPLGRRGSSSMAGQEGV